MVIGFRGPPFFRSPFPVSRVTFERTPYVSNDNVPSGSGERRLRLSRLLAALFVLAAILAAGYWLLRESPAAKPIATEAPKDIAALFESIQGSVKTREVGGLDWRTAEIKVPLRKSDLVRTTQTFVLDANMRERLAQLNPTASAKVANRLLEAHERKYWQPDANVLEALRRAGEELEDRLEGIGVEAAA